MSEPNKKQELGDGGDNYGGAAGQAAKAGKAAKQAGKEVAKQAAAKGAEATANAAAATVKAGIAGGKAVAEIATGTAVGGPLGAIVSIAWSMRHTLFKVLVCICLFIVFWIIVIVSLPSIVSDYLFGSDTAPPVEGSTITSVYDTLEASVSAKVEAGYNDALAEVGQIIAGGGYNYELSMASLINYAQSTAGYDTCYILAAYSASMSQRGTSEADMLLKLDGVLGDMFPVTYVEKTGAITVENPNGTFSQVTVTYVECTIHPFNNNVISTAFGIDVTATYGAFNTTYGEAITYMANSLKSMLYGTATGGMAAPLTDAELIAYVNGQGCVGTRKSLLETALTLVGKVPYFWGGKSAAGWNDEWNTPKVVTSAGSSTTGTVRPYGLDCSGFTAWVYSTALGADIGLGGGAQYGNTVAVTAENLQVGDLGFLAKESGSGWAHVLMFAGYGDGGKRMWVHSTGGVGVVLNSPDYDSQLVLRRLNNVTY